MVNLINRDELKSFKKSIKDIEEYAKKHKFDLDYQKQLKLLRAKSIEYQDYKNYKPI